MKIMLVAAAAASLSAPAMALNAIDGSLSIRNSGGLTFQQQFLSGYGITQLTADDGGFVKSTISAANGGTIRMIALSYNSTFSFASLLYSINVAGPDGGPVPMTISTRGFVLLQGNMTGTVSIGINWSGFDPVLGELSDHAFNLERTQCIGITQCQFPADGGSDWNYNNISFNLLPNRDYTVALNVALIQFAPPPDINAAGYGFGHAYVDPVINLAPTAVGYTLNSSLSGPAFPVGVPEPANWALLLAGFGLMGWQMRRRSAIGARHPQHIT